MRQFEMKTKNIHVAFNKYHSMPSQALGIGDTKMNQTQYLPSRNCLCCQGGGGRGIGNYDLVGYMLQWEALKVMEAS